MKNLDSEISKLEKDVKKLDLKFSMRKKKNKKNNIKSFYKYVF